MIAGVVVGGLGVCLVILVYCCAIVAGRASREEERRGIDRRNNELYGGVNHTDETS